MQKVYLWIPISGLIASIVHLFLRGETYTSVCMFLISSALFSFVLWIGGFQGREIKELKEELAQIKETQGKQNQELESKINQVITSVKMELGY